MKTRDQANARELLACGFTNGAADVRSIVKAERARVEARPLWALPSYSAAMRAEIRADWLACPWAPAAPESFGVPSGAELRAQRARQAEQEAERAAGASAELRAELRARLAQAARLGWNRPATNC